MDTNANKTMDFMEKDRQSWLSLMAVSEDAGLAEAWEKCEAEGMLSAPYSFLRRPEVGLTMVRGRVGGTGAPFNMGEMTVVRCVVSTADQQTGDVISGFACIAGRDKKRAERVARLDALFQDRKYGLKARAAVLERLQLMRQEKRQVSTSKTAATKVDFFTMERGS